MSTPALRVGVLALQGAVEPHRAAFGRLGVVAREVRARADLEGLTHLVLPGGESTTLDHLLRLFGLRQELIERQRSGALALFGTCAGAILLGRRPDGASGERPAPEPLGLLEVGVQRNAYGRQVDSFSRPLTLVDGGRFPGVFIRAPRFVSPAPELKVLARDGDEPVALEGAGLMATSFHPELTTDSFFHARFLHASRLPETVRLPVSTGGEAAR